MHDDFASDQNEPSKTHHRFKLGEKVTPHSPGIPSGTYVITRLLPLVEGQPHYRARRTKDGHERALLETQVRSIPEPQED